MTSTQPKTRSRTVRRFTPLPGTFQGLESGLLTFLLSMAVTRAPAAAFGVTTALLLAVGSTVVHPAPAAGQRLTGTENGEWRYLGGDAGNTRSSAVDQIDADNFGELETAWIWRSDNFGPTPDYFMRATPVYVDGTLYTVATPRRQVMAIDPATGETLWTFREPETTRHLRSPRQAYGKGVAYAEVDGRGVIYVTTPGFFLWALDAETGRPLEDWGAPVPLEDFQRLGGTGAVDLIPDLVSGWGRWEEYVADGGTYDPDYGIPRHLGMVTSSSPPIVVNGVVVVLVGHEPGYRQTRIENVPGDIMGFDAGTGGFLWKFHVIPRPGEFGHDTWENDAWRWSGDMSTWAPASADPELGMVYLVTNASTVQSYTGHRPGDNLFGGSVLALDVETGERVWHYQIHHSDQWNYDLPTAPILMDLEVDRSAAEDGTGAAGGGAAGTTETVPALIQFTKQGLVFVFDRRTGEPLWPIEERPVMQTEVPGNYTSPTQPYPTHPEPVDPIVWSGITEDLVIDYTPELKERALEVLSDFRVGGLYVPPLPYDHDHDYVNNVGCLGGGNVIPHVPVADPATGMFFASHHRTCSAPAFLEPTNGEDDEVTDFAEAEDEYDGATPNLTPTTGETVAAWLPGNSRNGRLPTIDGLRVWKPMDNQITAYDMGTGEKAWSLPVGETPERIRNHPLLEGVEVPNTGGGGFGSVQMVAGDLLVQTQAMSEGQAQRPPDGPVMLNARDKRTGEIVGSVELPAPGQYGMMTYLHEGRQYIVVQVGSAHTEFPGALVALALP